MSFTVRNTLVESSVNRSLSTLNDQNKNIAFCNATVSNLPVYFVLNSDTGGNVPEGAHVITGDYWNRIPFDTFNGVNQHIYFDGGGYFYVANPGYYRVTVNFSANVSDTTTSSFPVTLSMMNQSGGENNLYFPFELTSTSNTYSFTGILPCSMYDYNGDLHFSLNTNEVITIKLSSISVTISFYV